MLKTGYYAPEHPSSLQAKTGLYEEFGRLLENRDEITYIKFVQPDRTDVLVEGVIDEQFSLRSGMSGGMAELFIPRFIEYFIRHNLASFSIKKNINKQAFEAFLELMSKPYADRGGGKDDFLEKLLEHNISSVSVIFDVDLLGELKSLPWRVKLALARFVKDLRLLPIFKDSSAGKIAAAKKELIKEIIRPLKDPALLKDIVFNSDLVAKHMQDSGSIDLDETVVSSMPEPLVIKAGGLMLNEFNAFMKSKQEKKDGVYARKESRYFSGISSIAFRLIKDNSAQGDDLLEEIHSKNLITYESLPERIKKAIRVKEFAGKLAAKPNLYLNHILEHAYIEGNNTLADMAALALPELLKQEKLELVSDIAGIFEKNKAASKIIQKALIQLESGDILDELEQKLMTAQPDAANSILDIFRLAGKNAVPHLMNILLKIENISIRRRVINALIAMKANSEPALLKELRKKGHPWFMLRNIVFILGEIKSQTAPELFSELWQHEHPRVREEILSSTYKIFGKDGEGIFIEALEDKDNDVKKKAIYYLGMIRSVDKNVILHLTNLVKKRPADDKELADHLQVQAAISLGLIGNQSKEFHDVIEQTLINAVTHERKGLLGIGKTGMREKSDMVKIAVCGALAMLGSKNALPVLKNLSASKNDELKKASEDAIQKIESVPEVIPPPQ